ncbi:B12-binding domain-containing radical SAM protein [Rhodoplanes sp. SY1]|uniref:B12-binding domain-containing radical SAM protein n=1 Tax=Rhodoplanes sp. SY1 TaxID=3166646 RepID=UPI0038B654C2
MAASVATRRFQLVLIKPSHYDDDGYVIQWLRSSIPANSLACVHALAADAADRQVLGPDVAFDITAIDETNSRIKVDAIVARMGRHGGFGLVGLVGVQSNQFPRAMDIARPLRAAGVNVMIGGFHVSGQIAMLPERPPDLQEALDLGISLFAGEAEGRMDRVLADAAADRLEPIYDYMHDLPGLENAPVPFLPRETVGRVFDHHASFDAGRGCPFQCSFCTIINVQGRKSRRRTPDDVEALIRRHWAHGIKRFFITDDNFARNKDWEAIFDRIIKIREEERIDIRLIIQVDTLCHRIPSFVEKARRAGVTRVFIGLENINPANLMAANKRQNKITEYRTMLLAWKTAGVLTYAGYILGFPGDTPESIRADIEIIKRELPLDILEFFFLTPLPGSEDHRALWLKGVAMDPDMNKYDLEHAVTAHPRMSKAEWEAIYREAWETYYTPAHALTIFRRAAATGMGLSRLLAVMFVFSAALRIEKVHPLQVGGFRLKHRRDRRPGLPIEPVWSFWPKYLFEIVAKHVLMAKHWITLDLLRRKARREQARHPYTDLALTPVTDEETETLDMFTHSEDARRSVAHVRKVDALTHPTAQPQQHIVAAE